MRLRSTVGHSYRRFVIAKIWDETETKFIVKTDKDDYMNIHKNDESTDWVWVDVVEARDCAKGVGGHIQFKDENGRWCGDVLHITGEEKKAWKLSSGRIAKKMNVSVKWRWVRVLVTCNLCSNSVPVQRTPSLCRKCLKKEGLSTQGYKLCGSDACVQRVYLPEREGSTCPYVKRPVWVIPTMDQHCPNCGGALDKKENTTGAQDYAEKHENMVEEKGAQGADSAEIPAHTKAAKEYHETEMPLSSLSDVIGYNGHDRSPTQAASLTTTGTMSPTQAALLSPTGTMSPTQAALLSPGTQANEKIECDEYLSGCKALAQG